MFGFIRFVLRPHFTLSILWWSRRATLFIKFYSKGWNFDHGLSPRVRFFFFHFQLITYCLRRRLYGNYESKIKANCGYSKRKKSWQWNVFFCLWSRVKIANANFYRNDQINFELYTSSCLASCRIIALKLNYGPKFMVHWKFSCYKGLYQKV